MLYQFLHQVTVCFYWSHISFMDEVVALQLGFMAVIFVSQHWDNFGDELSVVLSDGNVVIHSQQYAQYMNTSGVYGDKAEIVAMSEILPKNASVVPQRSLALFPFVLATVCVRSPPPLFSLHYL